MIDTICGYFTRYLLIVYIHLDLVVSPLKNSICGQDVITVCVCVRCARWSRRDVRALRTESILFFPQISRNIVSFFVRSSFEHV